MQRGADRDTPSHGQAFAEALKAGRARMGWTQDDLIEESGVSRATILRWEAGNVRNPDPANVRKVFIALGLDPREAPVLLGMVTREEMGLAPEPPRTFDQTTEEVIRILEDPDLPEAQKREWVQYLRFRTGRDPRDRSTRRRRAG